MTQDRREFDLVIFGATGLTGRYAVEEIALSLAEVKWAVAGRNEGKLKESLKIVQGYLPEEIQIEDTQIILADVQDPKSIHQMCRRTKLLVNCVGPYNLFGGEMIVSTCIECKTHYIDISAEIKYLDTVLANYFEQARRNEVYVIEACGFGSLPGDYGVSLLRKKFSGGLKSVEYFVEFGDGPTGKPVGYGTFSSFLDSLWDYFLPSKFEKEVEDKVFRNMPSKSKLPTTKNIGSRDFSVAYSSKESAWCVQYYGPDARSIKRSQRIRSCYLDSEEQIEAHCRFKFPSLFQFFRYLSALLINAVLCLFSSGKALQQQYPYFFSLGLFSKEGPSRQQILESFTKITFYAEGWDKSLVEPEKHLKKIKIKLTMTGPEVAYALTTLCMVQAALTVLQDMDRMPLKGGVFTPGVAFENTRLHERLEKRGMAFEYEEIS